jgi:hypothetical protein
MFLLRARVLVLLVLWVVGLHAKEDLQADQHLQMRNNELNTAVGLEAFSKKAAPFNPLTFNAGGRHLLRSKQVSKSRGGNRMAAKKKDRARNKLHKLNKAHARHIKSVSAKAKKKKVKSVRCDQPESPSNGSVKVSNKNIGGTASYSCNNGFSVEGARQRKCNSKGWWTPATPHCKKKGL